MAGRSDSSQGATVGAPGAVQQNGTANGVPAAAAAPAAKADATAIAPAHPLGPLSGDEISRSSSLIRAAWPEGTKFQFKVVTLLEPAKAELIPYLSAERKGQSTSSIDRRSFVVYYIRNTVSRQPRLVSAQNLLLGRVFVTCHTDTAETYPNSTSSTKQS